MSIFSKGPTQAQFDQLAAQYKALEQRVLMLNGKIITVASGLDVLLNRVAKLEAGPVDPDPMHKKAALERDIAEAQIKLRKMYE